MPGPDFVCPMCASGELVGRCIVCGREDTDDALAAQLAGLREEMEALEDRLAHGRTCRTCGGTGINPDYNPKIADKKQQ